MTRSIRNRFIAIFILSFPFVLFLGFVLTDLAGPLPPLQPLPNPNGYDDFVRAGEMASSDSAMAESMGTADLKKLVETDREALAVARAGLGKECRVPAEFSGTYQKNHIAEIVQLRKLGQAFVAEGRLAERERRFADAAKSYLDAIRLGDASARGGSLIDAMVGIAIDGTGISALQNIADELASQPCRETTGSLENLIAGRQSWQDALQQENGWSRRTFGWSGQISILLHGKERAKNLRRAEATLVSTQRKEDQLLVQLAARAYRLEKGHEIAHSADLVPDYLKFLPRDPLTGSNVVDTP